MNKRPPLTIKVSEDDYRFSLNEQAIKEITTKLMAMNIWDRMKRACGTEETIVPSIREWITKDAETLYEELYPKKEEDK
tara:strand:+ start:76 stop:312 length:237 start_codon:yes stop_codon:yes gene_type:complete